MRLSKFRPVLRLRHKRELSAALLIVSIVAGITLVSLNGAPNAKAALPAPGGVEGAALWLKADQDLQVNGSNQVEQWLDQSGSGFIATQAQASAPTHTNVITPTDGILKVDSAINFNPAADFSGATGRTLKGASTAAWNFANLQIFAAASAEGAPNGNLSATFSINGDWAAGNGVSGGGLGYLGSSKSYYLDGNGCSVALATATDGPHIGRGVYVSATNALGGHTWLDGIQKTTGPACGKGSTYEFFEIGGRTTGGSTYDRRVFKGKIPEVIVYTSALTATESQRVDSYLAIKYGVTLDPSANLDYLASDGTTKAWDATVNASYYNNVFGIGRDDNSALNQKQSESQNPQGVVTVGHNTIEGTNQDNPNNFASNLSFLMSGDDNAAVDSWVDTGVPALDNQDFKQIPREWKVQKTGTVGPLTVSFNVDNPNADIIEAIENYYLLNLTTGQATLLSSNDGNDFAASGINFNDGDVYTIGTFNAQHDVHLRKTVNPVLSSISPGQAFTYSVTVENLGNAPATGLSFIDDLSDVVDDATYNNDVTSGGVGTPSWNGVDQISWTGNLNVGQTATITYSFTLNDPITGNGELDNGVVASGDGVNCTEDPAVDPDCRTVTPLPIVTSQKTLVSPANPEPGDTVNYQFVITNGGGAAASTVLAADDLSEVLDDATFNNDQVATSGNLSYNPHTKRLSWNGSLAANGNAGDSVTVTFSVTVNDATSLGDAVLDNALISPDCPNPPIFDSGNPSYEANCVTSTPITAWVANKTVSPTGNVDPGDSLTYTIEVENTGAVDLTGGSAPSLDDDLTNVLDDATYNNDAAASTGTPLLAGSTLSWTGDLSAGQTATITYSVTVKPADDLTDGHLANAVGAGPMNCPATPISNLGDPNFNADCAVLSLIDIPVPPEEPGGDGGGLADTGQSWLLFGILGVLLVGAGGLVLTRLKKA